MSWKPIKLGLPSRAARSVSPKKPSTLQPLRTTYDVRNAYLHRQDTIATPAGLYTFQRGRQLQSQSATASASADPSLATSSAIGHSPISGHHSSSLPGLPASELGWSSSFSDPHELPNDTTIIKLSKAKKQWAKWSTEIIPSLLHPYLRLLRVTDSLRNLRHDEALECTCGNAQLRQLTVTCLYFDGTFSLCYVPSHADFGLSALKDQTISVCQCHSAPQILLSRGFFPCSPVTPSLAVDIKLLEFARLQFLHLVPNTTGWCDAMESFLNGLLFKLTTRVSNFADITHAAGSSAVRTEHSPPPVQQLHALVPHTFRLHRSPCSTFSQFYPT